MKRLLKILFLPVWKKKLLCESIIFVWIIRISLWIFPYRRLNKWLTQLYSAENDCPDVNWDLIYSVVRSVRVCSRFVPRATCLTQALATQTLLGLRKQDSQLKIGVKRDEGGKFMAHAWVEVNGKIIIGKLPYHKRFVVLSQSYPVVI